MSSPAPLSSELSGPPPEPARRQPSPRGWLTRIRGGEFAAAARTARFRARQRRRTVAASRAGFLVIAGAVTFDAVALAFQPGAGLPLVILNGAVALLAILGFIALGRRLRRWPEPITALVTLAVTGATAVTGFALPTLSIQTIGYLLLIPGLVALIVPWSTGAHVRWLAAYALIALAYMLYGPSPVLNDSDRGDLIVVVVIAVATSLAGHVLLLRAQVRNHLQLQKIQALHRKADADMAELARVHHELEETSRLDPLTGAGNRLRLREDLRSARARMDRLRQNHGLVAIDLDHFKRVNDEFGHLAGDTVLKSVVALIKDTIRAEDAVYRFGGEEFLVLLRVTTATDLETAAERLRAAVADARIEHPRNEPTNVVTISLGGVLLTPADLVQSDDEWFAKADGALYAAKANGRNRVEIAA